MTIDSGRLPAIQRLLQKMASAPDSRAFVQLADLYLQCDLFEEAVGVLSEGIQRHPAYVAARMMRGKIYIQTRRIHEAKDDFEAVIAAHPEHIQAYRNLAHIYRTLGKLGEAVTMYNKILAIDPQDNAAQNLLLAIQDEIATMDEIRALAASHDAPAAPDPAPSPDAPVLDLSWEEPKRPETAWVSDESLAPTLFPMEPAVPPAVAVPPAAPKQARHDAQDALTALNRTRLQTWLASIQTRRKKDEFSGRT